MEACGASRLNCAACPWETATVTGGANLNNGAWCLDNPDELLGAAFRGSDLLIPGADWVLPGERFNDSFTVSLQLSFDGNVNAAGVSYSPLDVMEGLELNRRAFLAAVATPPDTRTLTLTLSDATTVAGPVRSERFLWSRGQVAGMARAVWRVTFPEGLT